MRDKMARSKGDGSVLYLSDVIKYLDTVSKVQNKTVPFCRASGWNLFCVSEACEWKTQVR